MPNGHIKPLLRAVSGETMSRPPWWLMRQAGRYLPEYREIRARTRDFIELCLSPTLAAEVTPQTVQRYRTHVAIMFSDILMRPYALWQKLAYAECEVPVLDRIEFRSGLSL